MLRDDAHLLDILKAARLAIEFKGLADKTAFLADAKTQSAVLHQLLILAEAMKRVSPEFRIVHPEVPWKAIAGTRDQLIHFCEGAPAPSLSPWLAAMYERANPQTQKGTRIFRVTIRRSRDCRN